MKKFYKTLILLMFLSSISSLPIATAAAAPLPALGQSTSVAVVATGTSDSSGLHQLATKAKGSWPYYVSRSAGLVAAALLALLVISGIGQVTGYTFRLMEPLAAWTLHRALAIALGVSILIHVGALLFDKYAPFNIFQLLIPFLSHYRPVTIWGVHMGSLYVALGVLALYAAAIVILSSLFWMEKKPVLWRLLHYTGYLLVLLTFLHGIYLGTDIRHGISKFIWWSAAVVILLSVFSRLWRARTINDHKDQ